MRLPCSRPIAMAAEGAEVRRLQLGWCADRLTAQAIGLRQFRRPQKYIFNANWPIRAGVDVLKIFPPTAGRSTFRPGSLVANGKPFGFARLVRLNALKYSARNCKYMRSVK